MTTLGIAAIQLAGKKSGNIDLLAAEIRSAAKRFPWVNLVVTGELAVHGVSTDYCERYEETERFFCALARELKLWLQPGSFYEDRNGLIYNVAPVIDPEGNVVARHDKMFPFLPYEKNITAGQSYCVFDMPGIGRAGVAICYDMWFPETIRTLACMGAEVILLPTMTNTVDRDVEVSIARANAAVNQCYFIDVNVAGEQGNGRSVFYGPGGELLHECGTGREVVTLELDLEQVRRARQRGWHGLGQVLKSFRDTDVPFPLHGSRQERSSAMEQAVPDLGKLAMPKRQSDTNGQEDRSKKEHEDRDRQTIHQGLRAID